MAPISTQVLIATAATPAAAAAATNGQQQRAHAHAAFRGDERGDSSEDAPSASPAPSDHSPWPGGGGGGGRPGDLVFPLGKHDLTSLSHTPTPDDSRLDREHLSPPGNPLAHSSPRGSDSQPSRSDAYHGRSISPSPSEHARPAGVQLHSHALSSSDRERSGGGGGGGGPWTLATPASTRNSTHRPRGSGSSGGSGRTHGAAAVAAAAGTLSPGSLPKEHHPSLGLSSFSAVSTAGGVTSSAGGAGAGGGGAQTFGDERSMVLRAHHEAIINRRHGGGGGGGEDRRGGGVADAAHTSYALQHFPNPGFGNGGPRAPVSPTHTVLAGGGRGSLLASGSGRTSPSVSDMPAPSDVDAGHHHHHRLDFGGGAGGGGGGSTGGGGAGGRDPERDPELSHTYTYHTLISHTRGGVDAEEERERMLERDRAEEERERKLREMVIAHRAGAAASGRTAAGGGSGAPESPLTVVRRLAGSPGGPGRDSLYDRSQVINVSAYGYAHHATRHTHRAGGGAHSVLHSYAASARHHRGGSGVSPDPLGEHDHEHDADADHDHEHEHDHEHDEAFADLSHAHTHEPEASMSGFGSGAGSATRFHVSHAHTLHASESTTHTAAASPIPAASPVRKISLLKKESVTAPVSFGLTR